MDDERFDRWMVEWDGRSTRRGFGALAVGAIAALGVGTEADAKKKKKKKKKKARSGGCKPEPNTVLCNGRCGSVFNRCGQVTNCGSCGEYVFETTWGAEGDASGQFENPDAVAVDASGNVYVIEHGNDRVQKFNSETAFQTAWGSGGSGEGQFAFGTGLAIAPDGHVFAVDSSLNRVQKFTSEGEFVTEWGSTGSGEGQFNTPTCVVVDASGDVYVGDSGNSRIQKFDSDGDPLGAFGSNGSGDGQFRGIRGVGIDDDGNIYVGDAGNFRIQRFNSEGVFQTAWIGFNVLTDLAVAGNGRVFALESGGRFRFSVYTSNGIFLTSLGDLGSGNGEFDGPSGIAVDGDGNVYVADTDNHRIQKFAPVGFASRLGADTRGRPTTRRKRGRKGVA